MMLRLPAENFTRNPFELGWSPDKSTSTPAFISSSLYFPMALRSSGLGILPASESGFALTIIMNRTVLSPSASESNEEPQDRHSRRENFPEGLKFPAPDESPPFPIARPECAWQYRSLHPGLWPRLRRSRLAAPASPRTGHPSPGACHCWRECWLRSTLGEAAPPLSTFLWRRVPER